jgi:hypothetical protein
MADPVLFDRASAERIANAVRKVEIGDRSESALRFDVVPPSQQRKTFRIATFTGAWAINATKTVTFKYQTSTPNTASVLNLVCGLSPPGSCDVSIARDGTSWHLVQPNLTQQPGYSASGTHVLTIQNGVLRWIGTTAC